ncbi:MAG: MBL fold metallo-hydrolase [Planctomycetota bacterium]|nr:MBL fold metallo-hydrolase [Planctomycetota bacterium]
MRLIFLGTSAGSVAVSDRQHASFVIEDANCLYWFDAGEGCTRTAYLLGIDLLQTRAIFLSHMAMDHIAGLPRLLWTLRKLNQQSPHHPLAARDLSLFIPHPQAWSGIIEMLEGTTHNHFARDFLLRVMQYHDGEIFSAENIRVIAAHNSHQGLPWKDDAWPSYGFRVEIGERSIVYSGDISQLSELDPLFAKPCDLAIIDASHGAIDEIATYFKQRSFPISRLALFHLDAETAAKAQTAASRVEAILGISPLVPNDGQILQF